MVHSHRILLARFLWMVLLLSGIASRLPAQDPVLGTASEDVQTQDVAAKVVSLPELAGKTTPTTKLQAPGLEHLLNQLEAFRKAHTPFHLRYREVIKVHNATEGKFLASIGYAPGKRFDTEYESAFWDNRSWKRCLGFGVDGDQASDKHLGGDRIGTPGRDVPLPLIGVFIEPKPENCQLKFDDIFPHITVTADEHKGRFELWMFPVSGQWFPKRIRFTPEDKDEPIVEWEVNHVKAFGKDRPPQIIDGEVRTTYRDGDQETTITTEFVVTKALYGEDVVPGDIDPSLAPIPAPPVTPTSPAQEAESRVSDGPKTELVLIAPTVEALTAALKNCDGFVLMMGERNILLPNLHSVDDAVLARRILNEVDGNKAIELFAQGTDILIRTPQQDFARPDLHDGIRFTRTIMEAQEHPETVTDRANRNSVPLTHSPDGVAYFPDAGDGTRSDAAEPQVASPANVRVFALKNARAADAARIIEQLYKQSLSVAGDERTNSLIVRSTDESMDEVQALLTRLDDAAGTPTSTESASGPALQSPNQRGATMTVPAVGLTAQSIDLSFRDSNQQSSTFSLSIGFTGHNTSELRQQYDALERQARTLSEQLRKPLPDPATGEKLKTQLRDSVSQAFETRQKLQRAELAEFAKRLQGIQQSIELRDKISQQIIERRVQELLDPNLKWETPEANSGRAQALRSPATDSTGQVPTPDGSRRAATSAPSAAEKSPAEMHEILAQRAEQVRQIREHISRYEKQIAAGQEVEDSRRSLESVRRQLDEYSRKQKLAWEEYRQQLMLLEANLELEDSRLKLAEDKVKTLGRLVEKGAATVIEIQEAKLKVQQALVARQKAEASLNVYRQAGEGLDSQKNNDSLNHSEIRSQNKQVDRVFGVSEKAVKIQALLFDLDEKAEEFDLSKVQHDAPDDLDAMLKEAAAKGKVTILSRPQMITRLHQESLLLIGQSVPLATNGDQVTSSRDVGVKVGITPREEDGKPVLKVAFDFSRIDPVAPTNAPDSTLFIQSNSGELTVRMNEYGGKGKLLGPFKAVPGKHRFLHLIVTLTDDVAASPIPPVLQGAWQFQNFAITGDPNYPPIPEHLVDEMKGRPPLVIYGDQMTRTKRDGTQDVYAIQYDATTTPHRLTTTTFRGGQSRTQRYIVQVEPGYLRLGATTDGRGNFPNSFDEPRTLVETYKRVPTEPARLDTDSEVNGSPKSSAALPIKLDDLQGNWRLIITGQATGKNDGGKTERQVLDATIRGNRLTASTNPIQAAENEGQHANSPLQMILHLDGTGDPQPVDLEYVLEASEAEEFKESIDFFALRNGKPIAQAIIERRGDGFRLCIEHAKIVGRPLAFELGETAGLWELRPIEPEGGKRAPDQPAANSQSSTDMPENSPPLNNRVIPSSDQNSPQAVLDAIRRCQEQKDYSGFVALLSDEEAARMTGIMLQSAVSFSLMIGFIEKSPNPAANPDLLELQKIIAIVDRYTVDDPDVKAQDSFHQIAAIGERQMAVQIPGAEESQIPLPDWNAEQYSLHLRTAARVISDQRAFLADMMKAMVEFNPSPEKPAVPNWRLEVNGDQAVATAAAESKNVGFMTPATTQFRKVDGHWRISSLISDEQLMKLIQASGSSERTETPRPPDIQDHSAKSI